MSTPEQLFDDLLARRPADPFVTYYDERTGERSELSARSLANWVAKTHHLLGDGLGLGPGDTALVALPAHWISVPVVLGCLTAGLHVVDAGRTDVAFVTPASLAAADAADVFAVAPDAAAVGFRDAPPAGADDYVLAVRPQADKWAGVRLAGTEHDPGVGSYRRGDAVRAATAVAARERWPDGVRLLSTREWRTSDDWIETLLAPLAVGGSVVYVTGTDDAAVLDRRAEQERATARLTAA